MIASGLDPSCEGGVTGRNQNPAFRDRQHFAIGGSDGVRRRAWDESVAHPWFVAFCMGLPKNAYVAVPTTATCNTTTHQNTIRKDSFLVLWRNCRCPSNAPGQPPNRAGMCKV